MSQSSSSPQPYIKLGQQLKNYRKAKHESLAEVSGAVEIDEHVLERYEAGLDRPDEEILNLLISHYRLADPLAMQLWELAGYAGNLDDIDMIEEALASARQLVMVLATDNRTIYSDGVNIDCNQLGLQVTFTQSNQQGKGMPIARIGMSYEQGAEVIKALTIALGYGKYGRGQMLPPGKRV